MELMMFFICFVVWHYFHECDGSFSELIIESILLMD